MLGEGRVFVFASQSTHPLKQIFLWGIMLQFDIGMLKTARIMRFRTFLYFKRTNIFFSTEVQCGDVSFLHQLVRSQEDWERWVTWQDISGLCMTSSQLRVAGCEHHHFQSWYPRYQPWRQEKQHVTNLLMWWIMFYGSWVSLVGVKGDW